MERVYRGKMGLSFALNFSEIIKLVPNLNGLPNSSIILFFFFSFQVIIWSDLSGRSLHITFLILLFFYLFFRVIDTLYLLNLNAISIWSQTIFFDNMHPKVWKALRIAPLWPLSVNWPLKLIDLRFSLCTPQF